ncbi:metal-dependent protein hydrolase [Pelomyxa schiedti]|nr:metal-dependent protein hydrolase [Pelomyxa schiedti]
MDTTSSPSSSTTVPTTKARPRIAVHGSTFHLDDATCVFMLKQLPQWRDAEVVREVVADEARLAACDVVCDFGGSYNHAARRYDHHQKGYFECFSPKFAKIKMAATGLVYRHYGRDVIRALSSVELDPVQLEKVYNKLYEELLASVDGPDNGINAYPEDVEPLFYDHTSLHERVSSLNPRWNQVCTDETRLIGFMKAVELAGEAFRDSLSFLVESWLPSRLIVEQAYNSRTRHHPSGHIMVFETPAPWKDHLRDIEEEEASARTPGSAPSPLVLYGLVFDNARNQWAAVCVTKKKGSFQNRLSFPESWRGLVNEKLTAVTGIPGSQFVHASGFLACNATLEGAIQMTATSVEMQRDSLP